ncbi:MAG: porin family protein [Bacteroidales bacterium]|nr:porin family protein [Bacteroidales bacterium]
MKKIILTLALLLSMAWATPASALGLDWGITGGLNLTKLKLKGDAKQVLKSDNQAGWFIGPKAHVSLALGFGLDGALLYSQQKYSVTEKESGDSEYKTSRSIEIPINLRYSIGLGSIASVFVTTGPQFDFNIGSKNWANGMFERSNMTTSWNIGAGVKVLSRVEVGVGYNFALGKVGEAIIENAGGGSYLGSAENYRSNTFTAQATIYF